jgi:hypothetical protein
MDDRIAAVGRSTAFFFRYLLARDEAQKLSATFFGGGEIKYSVTSLSAFPT